jgi:hypothetical protein
MFRKEGAASCVTVLLSFSHLISSHLICPVLSCPVLSCPVLSCPALSCPSFPVFSSECLLRMLCYAMLSAVSVVVVWYGMVWCW